MVPRYMLDTNICIYIRQRRPPEVLKRFQSLHHGESVISVVTYGELRAGVEKSGAREQAIQILDELMTLIPVQALPAAAGIAYGAIRTALERRGDLIGNNDLWIAAHARVSDLTLVTNNEREFKRVPGLKIENWASS
jgi:tRNA(fMet)-specific endonuclease VapC